MGRQTAVCRNIYTASKKKKNQQNGNMHYNLACGVRQHIWTPHCIWPINCWCRPLIRISVVMMFIKTPIGRRFSIINNFVTSFVQIMSTKTNMLSFCHFCSSILNQCSCTSSDRMIFICTCFNTHVSYKTASFVSTCEAKRVLRF